MSFNIKWALSAATCAALFLASMPKTMAEDEISGHKLIFGVKPLQGADMSEIQAQSDAGVGLKTWTYQVTSSRTGSKGQEFSGVMVGNSPITTNGTTTTTVYVVPLIFKIGGETFSPTLADSACLDGKVPLTILKSSPMVVATHDFEVNGVNVGAAQYSDAFQRANFWTHVVANGGTYHNKLAYKFLSPITVTPGSSNSVLFSLTGGCISSYGGVEVNWFDNLLTTKVIPALASKGVGPTNLPVFMMYNTTMYNTIPNQCCIGGYHGAVGSPAQTYAPFQFDTVGVFGVDSEDTDIMAHEIDEWQDDPLGTNPTPPWGHVGQVTTGCQSNLEVGDPLTNKNYPNVILNGFTYHLQELAFFSWFFGPPSIGAGGKFSDNGSFKGAQGVCKATAF